LTLSQAGWSAAGTFREGSVVLELDGEFALDPQLGQALREPRQDQWSELGNVNLRQVGISAIRISRTSDEAFGSHHDDAHRMLVKVHENDYYDFLATHRLRLTGSDSERETLDRLVGVPDPRVAIAAFPNPCSVGLSLLCDGGKTLVLTRRSESSSSGGLWEGGQHYNAVGENVAPRDFTISSGGARHTTPQTVARRGLFEEVGFTEADIEECELAIHSLAWASDLLDHKFFGYAVTPLSGAEVLNRWRSAPDRSESKGDNLDLRPVDSPTACRSLIESISTDHDEWSPEATFSTLRTLLAGDWSAPMTSSRQSLESVPDRESEAITA
jgi:hypothetical protein